MIYIYIILLQSLAANKAYDKLDMTIEDALRNREIVSDQLYLSESEDFVGGPFYFLLIYRKYLLLFASL